MDQISENSAKWILRARVAQSQFLGGSLLLAGKCWCIDGNGDPGTCHNSADLIRAAVLNSSPRAPPLYIFVMSLLVNTPDSDNQLVRSALHEWTVFRLTCSLHSVHCSLLPEQGKAAEVYFTSEHSFMDLRCATSLRTDECDIIYVCKYIQFKFTSRTLQCTMNGIRSLRTGIMEEYRVMSTSQGTCVRIEQTSEVIRVTYEMCRAVGREDWNWEPLH